MKRLDNWAGLRGDVFGRYRADVRRRCRPVDFWLPSIRKLKQPMAVGNEGEAVNYVSTGHWRAQEKEWLIMNQNRKHTTNKYSIVARFEGGVIRLENICRKFLRKSFWKLPLITQKMISKSKISN